MKFSVQLPTDRVEDGDEYTSSDSIAEMAEAIERAGFDACWVTEHPFPSDEWIASGGHHSLDPFVALTAAAIENVMLTAKPSCDTSRLRGSTPLTDSMTAAMKFT